MEESAKDFTTFVCPFGRFRYRTMPFGLRNAPAIFQALMEKVLAGCVEYCSVYIDDVLVFSNSWTEHLHHVKEVLLALRKAGLTAKPFKCERGKSHLDYLGHRVGSGQVAVPESRVEAIESYRQPVTRRDLRAFIGTAGYYRRFIRDFAKFHAILSPSTSGKAPGTVQWTPEMLNAFHCLRHGLSEYVILNVPCVSDSFQLHTDASGVGVGAALHVIRSGSVLPVGFYSRKLKGAELR